jgi:hypothetical protein
MSTVTGQDVMPGCVVGVPIVANRPFDRPGPTMRLNDTPPTPACADNA